MKKKTLLLLVVLSFGFTNTKSNCELKNGKYKVIYNSNYSEYSQFDFVIKNENFITKGNKHKIKWISKNQFRLITKNQKKDSLTDISKKLNSLGTPFYEIISSKKDTINFVYMHTAHITINEGKFIKIK